MASADTANQPCWCYGVSIDPQVLQALPLEQQNLACLCPRCANVLSQLPPAQAERLA